MPVCRRGRAACPCVFQDASSWVAARRAVALAVLTVALAVQRVALAVLTVALTVQTVVLAVQTVVLAVQTVVLAVQIVALAVQVVAVFMSQSPLFKTLNLFPPERNLVDAERAKGSYAVLPYFASKLLAELPLAALYPMLFSAIVYPMTGLPSVRPPFISVCYNKDAASQPAWPALRLI